MCWEWCWFMVFSHFWKHPQHQLQSVSTSLSIFLARPFIFIIAGINRRQRKSFPSFSQELLNWTARAFSTSATNADGDLSRRQYALMNKKVSNHIWGKNCQGIWYLISVLSELKKMHMIYDQECANWFLSLLWHDVDQKVNGNSFCAIAKDKRTDD